MRSNCHGLARPPWHLRDCPRQRDREGPHPLQDTGARPSINHHFRAPCRVRPAKQSFSTQSAKYSQSSPWLTRGNVRRIGFIEFVTNHLPGAVKVPAIHIDGDHRDLRLDACRGLALWFIFMDHIPGNSLAWLTLRNYAWRQLRKMKTNRLRIGSRLGCVSSVLHQNLASVSTQAHAKAMPGATLVLRTGQRPRSPKRCNSQEGRMRASPNAEINSRLKAFP
jgi:hypothetical protein